MQNSGSQLGGRGGGLNVWFVAGWAILALFGLGIIVVGLALSGDDRPQAEATRPALTVAAVPSVLPTIMPTYTPETASLPTVPPATATTALPTIEAGELGANVRSGPGMDFEDVGRLEAGQKVVVIGRYGDWWQIDYGGTPAWVANWVVTAYNTEGVPEVEPPPSPIPPTEAPPTKAPPTVTPIPPTAMPDTRGLRADAFFAGYKVGEAVQPAITFGESEDVWFYMSMTNMGGPIVLTEGGIWVEETLDFQKSWGGPGSSGPITIEGAYTKVWLDHLNQFTLRTGVYHMWLRVCFTDGYCVNLAGPVTVDIG